MIAILDYICLGFKANIRKDAGVVERGGLEIRYTALLYPGFESLSFRTIRNGEICGSLLFLCPLKLYNCTTFPIFVL